jgi:hypothetical protein
LCGVWRKRWDSNPRDLAVYLISSQARYDHFDTLPKHCQPIIRRLSHIQLINKQ